MHNYIKKARIIALAFLLLASGFCKVSAAGGEIQARPGDAIRFTVSLNDSATLAGFRIYVDYDTSVFSLKKTDDEFAVEQGDFSAKGTMIPNVTSTGCQVLWFHTSNVTASGSLFTITLEIAENAAPGNYAITTRVSDADTVDSKGNKVAISCNSGEIAVSGSSEPTAQASIAATSTEQIIGTTFTMPVFIRDNPGIAGFTLSVSVPDGLTLTAIRQGSLLCSGFFMENLSEKSVTWYDSSNISGDGELLLLDFKVEDACTAGEHTVSLSLSDGLAKNLTDENQNAVSVKFEDAQIRVLRYVRGDADGDGDVTVADAIMIARHLIHLETLTGTSLKAADVDRDGYITSADCVRLARYLSELVETL